MVLINYRGLLFLQFESMGEVVLMLLLPEGVEYQANLNHLPFSRAYN